MLRSLAFEVLGSHALTTAASPALALRMRIRETAGRTVEALVLQVQVQIQPRGRRYEAVEEERLSELFGSRERWGETLHTLLWAHVPLAVPGFAGATEIDVPLPCSYDFDVATFKYLAGINGGAVPLRLLFSGTIFGVTDGKLSVERVPWELEAAYNLPTEHYRAALDAHFPNAAWIRLGRAAFDDLNRFKISRMHLTWDAAIESLLDGTRTPL